MSRINQTTRSYSPMLRPSDWPEFLKTFNSVAETLVGTTLQAESDKKKIGYLVLGNLKVEAIKKYGLKNLADEFGAWVAKRRGSEFWVALSNVIATEYDYATPMRCGAVDCSDTSKSASQGFGVFLAHLLGINLTYKKLAPADWQSVYHNVKAESRDLLEWYPRSAIKTWSNKAHYFSSVVKTETDPVLQHVRMLAERLAKVIVKPILLTVASCTTSEEAREVALPGQWSANGSEYDSGVYASGNYFVDSDLVAFASQEGVKVVPEVLAKSLAIGYGEQVGVAEDNIDLVTSPSVFTPAYAKEDACPEHLKRLYADTKWARLMRVPRVGFSEFIDAKETARCAAAEIFLTLVGVAGCQDWSLYGIAGSIAEWFGPEADSGFPITAALSRSDSYNTCEHEVLVISKADGVLGLSMAKSAWSALEEHPLVALAASSSGCKIDFVDGTAARVKLAKLELDGDHPAADPYMALSNVFGAADSDGNELDAAQMLAWDSSNDGLQDKKSKEVRAFDFKASDAYVVLNLTCELLPKAN